MNPTRANSNQVTPLRALIKFGVDPREWISIDPELAVSARTIQEFDSLVLDEAARHGKGGESFTFRYPAHLVGQLASDGEPESAPVMNNPLPQGEDFASHAGPQTRRKAFKHLAAVGAAVATLATLGSVKSPSVAADHLCTCCRWSRHGSTGQACYTDWYSNSCTQYCCSRFVGYSDACAKFGSCYSFPSSAC